MLSPLLFLGFVALIALLGAAGTHFIQAHLAILKIRREGGGMNGRMSEEWRRYRHPHLQQSTPVQPGRFAAAMRHNLIGFILLIAAFVLMALLFRAL